MIQWPLCTLWGRFVSNFLYCNYSSAINKIFRLGSHWMSNWISCLCARKWFVKPKQYMLMYPTSEWFEYDKIRPIHKSVFRVKVAQRCHLTCLDFHECPRHHYVTKKGLIEIECCIIQLQPRSEGFKSSDIYRGNYLMTRNAR